MMNDAGAVECSPRSITLMQGLQDRRQRLAEELASVDAAISALNSNPQIQDVLNLLSKVNGIRY